MVPAAEYWLPMPEGFQKMDYAALSLADLGAGLADIARDTQTTFGGLDARQLNWQPRPGQWSIGQCFDHLRKVNGMMFQSAEEALDNTRPRTIWQRLPLLPGVLGRIMIRSQAPGSERKYTAPAKAQASSDIAADIIQRFVEQHRDAVSWVQSLDDRDAAGSIMTSPFLKVITYTVLDGCRLVVAHDRRHFEQACRVKLSPEFPNL
jgi:hypothetical protein